jgi:G protein-coupled receptor 157
VAAAALGALGYDEEFSSSWCWIRAFDSIDERIKWHLLEGKAWEIIALVATPAIYILIKYENLRRRREALDGSGSALITHEARAAMQSADRKLVWVPVIFIFLRVWGTVRFLINIDKAAPTHDVFFLQLLQVA